MLTHFWGKKKKPPDPLEKFGPCTYAFEVDMVVILNFSLSKTSFMLCTKYYINWYEI